METIKPKKLIKSNKIGIAGISGEITDYSKLENAKKFFESQGYEAVISETCRHSHRYMAGYDDKECADTLCCFFEDKSIDAILCARGGYGTLRLLKYIDWNIIRNNPKIFAGYSDITVLLNMIFKKTGLITFHSAMPYGDFSGKISPYTEKSFFKTLSGLNYKYKAKNYTTYYKGISMGKLWGGNLSTLVSLCGLDFIPDENLILLLEDINEPSYKIDKMLTQLFNIEKIRKNVQGIAFGDFLNTDNKDYLNNLINELADELKIPVCNGFKITHSKIKDTIPIGVSAEFSSTEGIISVSESYTV